MADAAKKKTTASRETIDIAKKKGISGSSCTQEKSYSAALVEISKLLNTGLDAETLTTCVRLLESGINPEALAMVIQELRRETAAVRAAEG